MHSWRRKRAGDDYNGTFLITQQWHVWKNWCRRWDHLWWFTRLDGLFSHHNSGELCCLCLENLKVSNFDHIQIVFLLDSSHINQQKRESGRCRSIYRGLGWGVGGFLVPGTKRWKKWWLQKRCEYTFRELLRYLWAKCQPPQMLKILPCADLAAHAGLESAFVWM